MSFFIIGLSIIGIGILLIITTIILALTVRIEIFKYFPAFIGLLAAIALCMFFTYVNGYYSNTEGIEDIYWLVFVFASPEVLSSLAIAAVFDIVRHFKKRKSSNSTSKL